MDYILNIKNINVFINTIYEYVMVPVYKMKASYCGIV